MTSANPESEYADTEPRRDIHIDRELYELFTDLKNSEESPLYEAENHDSFMFAVGYGRRHSEPQPTESEEHAFFGRSQLSDTQRSVLEAVAVSQEGTVQVLRDQRRVYELAEQFANAGVKKLYQRVFEEDGDPLSELTLEVKEAYETGTK